MQTPLEGWAESWEEEPFLEESCGERRRQEKEEACLRGQLQVLGKNEQVEIQCRPCSIPRGLGSVVMVGSRNLPLIYVPGGSDATISILTLGSMRDETQMPGSSDV